MTSTLYAARAPTGSGTATSSTPWTALGIDAGVPTAIRAASSAESVAARRLRRVAAPATR